MTETKGIPTSPSTPFRGRGRMLVAAGCVLALLAYAATGFFFVQPDERGVVRIFGRLYAAELGPGLHYAPPPPIGRVDRPKTTEVRRTAVGIDAATRELIASGNLDAISGSPQSDVLTGDTNILKVSLIVQYQVVDPARYVLRCVDVDELVRRAAQAVMVEALTRMPVDEVLTTAKVQLRDEVLTRCRKYLEAYDSGIVPVSASVQAIEPPAAVIAAFKDVTSAEYDRGRMIERARNTGETLIRDAMGYAAERVNSAEVYRDRRLAKARGEAAAFLKQHAEYARAPLVTRQRLLLTTLARVLPRVKNKIIIDDDAGRAPVELKLLEGIPPRAGS